MWWSFIFDVNAMKKSPTFLIFLTVFIDLLGFGIVLPLLPYYAHQEPFNASEWQIGMLVASYSLMQFIFAPIWGRVSDRVGRRPIILLSLMGSTVSYLIFGLAQTMWMLFLARMLAGIGAANIPTAQAYIADTTTPENRAKGMGMIGAAFGLGFIFGPAVGGFLSHWGYSVPGFVAAGICFADFALTYFLLPESLKEKGVSRPARHAARWSMITEAFSRPFVGTLLILFFIATFALANMEATFALLSKVRYHYTEAQTGYIFAYMGLLTTLVQGGMIRPLVRKLGEHKLIVIGTLVFAMSLLLLPYTPNFWTLAAALALLSFGQGVNTPSITSLISQYSSADEQGSILGVTQSLSSLARVVGPMWGGVMFDIGFQWPYLTAAGFMFVAFLLSLKNQAQARSMPALAINAPPEPVGQKQSSLHP
ncbi:MAG: MFS transporter [Acidobacteria bacterium]|nr:MFS transporter [Acidobacteriota bacterium]